MKLAHSFLKLVKIIISISLFSYPFAVFAKEINLFEQAKNDAKIVAKADLSTGIIPIYTPKEGGWIKVADPKNGNVGWVKSTDLANADSSQSTFTYTQRIVNDNKSPTTYQIIQFGQPTNLTPELAQTFVKQMQREQAALQQAMHKMMHNMDLFLHDDWHFIHDNHFAFLRPVVIVPVQKDRNINQSHLADKQPTLATSASTSPKQNTNNTTAIKK